MGKQQKRRQGSSLDDAVNATSGTDPVKKFRPTSIKPKDTVHVNSTAGYKMAVKRDSPYHKQAQKMGAVADSFRPTGPQTEDTDDLAVKNYAARPKTWEVKKGTKPKKKK